MKWIKILCCLKASSQTTLQAKLNTQSIPSRRTEENSSGQRISPYESTIFSTTKHSLESTAINYLSAGELSQAALVNKEWHAIFSNLTIWKAKLQQDFHITADILTKVNVTETLYRKLYCSLAMLLQKLPPIKRGNIYPDPCAYLRDFIIQHIQSPALLAYCLDDANYFDQHACEEEIVNDLPTWIELSLYFSKLNVAKFLLEQFHYPITYELIGLAARAGQLKATQFLLPHFRRDRSSLKSILTQAVYSGNLLLVHYLLNPKNGLRLKPNLFDLEAAAYVGDLQLVKCLLRYYPKIEVTEHALWSAARSGNLELLLFLLDARKDKYLDSCAALAAIESGNREMIQYMITHHHINPLMNWPDNFLICTDSPEVLEEFHQTYRIKSNYNHLYTAVSRGHLRIVQYLLNPTNGFKLALTRKVLNTMASVGDLAAVKFLLDTKNNFNLTPTQTTLIKACQSGNFELVKFLLHPRHGFGLTLNKKSLSIAMLANRLEIVKLHSDPALNLNIKATFREICGHFVNRQDLKHFAFLYYFLASTYSFNYDIKPSDLYPDGSVHVKLWQSHLKLQHAIRTLQTEDRLDTEAFQASHDEFPPHFFRWVDYLLTHPELLSKEAFNKFLTLKCVQQASNPKRTDSQPSATVDNKIVEEEARCLRKN